MVPCNYCFYILFVKTRLCEYCRYINSYKNLTSIILLLIFHSMFYLANMRLRHISLLFLKGVRIYLFDIFKINKALHNHNIPCLNEQIQTKKTTFFSLFIIYNYLIYSCWLFLFVYLLLFPICHFLLSYVIST